MPERCGQEIRKQCGRDTVGPCYASSQGDEGEHVEISRYDRGRCSCKKGPPCPPCDRRSKRQLDPRRRSTGDKPVHGEQVTTHSKQHDRNRQCDSDPEPARHLHEFQIANQFACRNQGLKGHAADGTVTWTLLPDVRMHRTGVDSTRWSGCHSGAIAMVIPVLMRCSARIAFLNRAHRE